MHMENLLKLDRILAEGIGGIPGLRLTNPTASRMPGIVSVIVEKKDFNNERFIKKISDQLALSTGSACSAGEPSYVIKALGLEDKTSKVLRITINKYTTMEDVKVLIDILKNNL